MCLIATAIQIHACDAFCYLLDDSSNLTSYVTLDYKNDLANLAFYFYIKLAWWLILLRLASSRFVSSRLVSSRVVSSRLVSSRLASSCLVSSVI